MDKTRGSGEQVSSFLMYHQDPAEALPTLCLLQVVARAYSFKILQKRAFDPAP
jgi:hypothetical protein